ncbi:hypothetical protein DSOL_4666 [Desulfosporosinus metallidurans]|uniref:Uncharacterized protein n=1 Tax=Desulfosporosinus metallidurans TaxID=1888891 RepID=A0A1Q8QIJ9_9FIRM|nr:hypothetical protein DSOL_4666 [Desulfosporosinus metallidurans]
MVSWETVEVMPITKTDALRQWKRASSSNHGQRLNHGSQQAAKDVCKARKHGTADPFKAESLQG